MRPYKADQVIFKRGDAAAHMMVVVSGKVQISSPSHEGDRIIFATMHPGDVFGEIALIDGHERSTDATAIEATELLEAETPAHRAEEYGDLLFVIVNLGRKLGIDPESALRAASRKFASRFARVERFAAERQVELRALGLDALDELWQEAKLEEAAERDVASALPDERRLG